MGKTKSIVWDHYEERLDGDELKYACLYCEKTYCANNATHKMKHLIKCDKAPESVKQEMEDYIDRHNATKDKSPTLLHDEPSTSGADYCPTDAANSTSDSPDMTPAASVRKRTTEKGCLKVSAKTSANTKDNALPAEKLSRTASIKSTGIAISTTGTGTKVITRDNTNSLSQEKPSTAGSDNSNSEANSKRTSDTPISSTIKATATNANPMGAGGRASATKSAGTRPKADSSDSGLHCSSSGFLNASLTLPCFNFNMGFSSTTITPNQILKILIAVVVSVFLFAYVHKT